MATDTRLIVAKIRDAEAQLEGAEKRTTEALLVLARHYQELVRVTKSGKEAAAIAAEAELRYSGQSHIRSITRWVELFDAVCAETGGVHSVHPPFTEGQVRPILATKYWDPIGAGGMADMWPGIEDGPDKVKRFVSAVKAHYVEHIEPTTTPNLKKKPAAKKVSRDAIRDAAVTFIKLNGWDEYRKIFTELANEHMPGRLVGQIELGNQTKGK